MSDRHIVEKKFNELLESYRVEVLPDIVEGWDSLSEDQQLSLTRMNNFFCGLHFLVGLADAAAETLKNWEVLIAEEDSVTEAGTLRLIRISCKAVQKQCSQQAGCHLLFKAYLESQSVHVFPNCQISGEPFQHYFSQCSRSVLPLRSSDTIFGRDAPKSQSVASSCAQRYQDSASLNWLPCLGTCE